MPKARIPWIDHIYTHAPLVGSSYHVVLPSHDSRVCVCVCEAIAITVAIDGPARAGGRMLQERRIGGGYRTTTSHDVNDA